MLGNKNIRLWIYSSVSWQRLFQEQFSLFHVVAWLWVLRMCTTLMCRSAESFLVSRINSQQDGGELLCLLELVSDNSYRVAHLPLTY